jgi:hypothetical protein
MDHARQVHDINVTPQFLLRARDRIENVELEPAGDVSREASRRG